MNVFLAPVRWWIAAVLLVFFCCSSVLPVEAALTGQISGVVRDATTHAPLAGAVVTATSPSGRYRAQTDASGKFAIVGVVPDTYTIAVDLKGYRAGVLSGVTVLADSAQPADIELSKALVVIGRTQARSASSAFQPNQTEDSYTVNARNIEGALGKNFNTNEDQLLAAQPSVTKDSSGTITIRGGSVFQTGYQVEGIDFTSPNRSLQNKSSNVGNFGLLNGISQLQLIPGGGDASHGDTGTGLVSILSKRGTYPASYSLDLETEVFPFNHQFGFEYGIAKPDSSLSNYFSFIGVRQDFQYGDRGVPGTQLGIFTDANTLRSARGQNVYGVGNLPGNQQSNDFVDNLIVKFGRDKRQQMQLYFQTQAIRQGQSYSGIGNTCYASCNPAAYAASLGNPLDYIQSVGLTQDTLSAITALYPGQTAFTQNVASEDQLYSPFTAFKAEYTNAFNDKGVLALRFSRTLNDQQQFQPSLGIYAPDSGGSRSTVGGDVTYQLSSKHLVQVGGKYEYARPFGTSTDYVGQIGAYYGFGDGTSVPITYPYVDFVAPGVCAANTPVAGSIAISGSGTGATAPCGYLAKYFPHGIPPLPPEVDRPVTDQQVYGLFAQDTWTVTSRLKAQLGLRLDGYNFLYPDDPTNAPGIATVRHQRLYEPHAGFTYRLTPRDTLRATYGRTLAIPLPGLTGNSIDRGAYAPFDTVPSFDNLNGVLPTTAAQLAADAAHYCGVSLKELCKTYGDQLYWLNRDAKYGAGALTSPLRGATFTNYDATYQHEFRGGFALSVTPFFRRGYDVLTQSNSINSINFTTGAISLGPTLYTNGGLEKTTGVEFLLTRDAAYGLSGQLAATYVNRLGNEPPTNYLSTASVVLGNIYRSPDFSPFQSTLVLQYRTRSGWRINPILSYNRGYPYGVGNVIQVFIDGVATNIPNTNINTTQVGNPPTLYVDPQNPGTKTAPNVIAGNGYNETASAGGILSRPAMNLDTTFEYSPPGSRTTYGLAITNVFNQLYGIPAANPNYVGVGTGFGYSTVPSALVPNAYGSSSYIVLPNRPPRTYRLYLQIGSR